MKKPIQPLHADTTKNDLPAPIQKTNSNNTESTQKSLMEASQTILFTTTTLQRTITRCMNCIGNESLYAAFSPILHKSKSSTDKLLSVLDVVEKRPECSYDLVQATSQCILVLKELCWVLRTRLSTVVQGLDTKFSRNLLINLYSATVDMKETWLVLKPLLTIDPIQTLTSFKSNRHPSETMVHSPVNTIHSPIDNNQQLYTHLRNAITTSLHVFTTLQQTIEDTLQTTISSSLKQKLTELTRQVHYATELSNRLDKNVEANMGNNKEELLLLPTRKESSRLIWEDTSIYLKAIVSVMSFIRAISTEEDFSWPKSIKQGCLYMTRMTAEVAKLWNNHSTFAEDGFILGRYERSSSVCSIDQCTSPASH
ncbi:uncharacterized protein B0P05DRAFT_565457 [Gilbertella persicaria]|uniref:uncharacterized protein n=1 Tax=Gilbertella persicaria TaxID=101096 RepID=UPI0022210459|nr:uncharacterized protein B0P05DRAFT_565457 [Gilbertella persicaria]KAI8047735.1 hypothetical protein B0P05DRAFT_565457 [Gilbertella persicaria]